MHILHVTTVHSRKDIRIFQKECVSLASAYDGVDLIVGDGKGVAVEKGVRFIDVGLASKSRIRRILLQPIRAFRRIRLESPDIVHLHDPELLPIGLMLAWSGLKVIYDAHEDVPRQILAKPWIPLFLRKGVSRSFEWFEDFVARRISGVVAATPHIAARFRRLNENTIDINNFPLPNELAPGAGPAKRGRSICYVGGISRIRGVKQLVEALPFVPNARLVLCGLFSDKQLEDEIRGLAGWAYVDYRGMVDRDELQKIMAKCCAGVVTFLPLPNHVDAQPNKMFEYMSAELPVIASDFLLWREIIIGSRAGVCVDPESPRSIAAAIEMLLNDPVLVNKLGRAGREAVLTKYNWPVEATRLINFYRDLP